ncbi:alpha/beta fold hydrolase [Roseovarius pacificus]|uniref:alpha/beta fold hydrolase n=1 Tax=Roseovarius pacificus TaxID=337701 RepID=UPI002968D17D|nr:alpha/beta fold hydrolase [Roseovarius pacificus]MDW3116953.1 alpha/beta fold hydrolase [Roseovarius pacificus]
MKTLRPTSAGPLEVIRRGPEQGETVIFLHHGFGTAASMQAVMDVFAVRWPDLRLIAYSRPGCGLSPKRAAAKSVDYLHIEATEVLPALLDAEGINIAHVVGHSDGGSIALIAAAQPDARAASVTAIAPHSFVEPHTISGVRALADKREDPAWRKALAQRHTDPGFAFESWLDLWLSTGMHRWSIRDLMDRICCPLGLLQGTEDSFGTRAQLDAILTRARSQKVGLHMVRDASHELHKEHPDAVADMWQFLTA